MDKRFTFGGQQAFNFRLRRRPVCGLALIFWQVGTPLVVAFFVLALAFGVRDDPAYRRRRCRW